MELSKKCVGGSVAKGKQGKKRQKVDNADLSQLVSCMGDINRCFISGTGSFSLQSFSRQCIY